MSGHEPRIEARTAAARLGQNLFRARTEADLSQDDVALRAAMHRTDVGEVERGERDVRIFTVIRLAASVEVAVSDLFDGIVDWQIKPLPPPIGDFEEPPLAEEIPRLWQEGRTEIEIAEMLGATTAAVASTVAELREAGVDLPYRRHPLTDVQRAARARRAAGAGDSTPPPPLSPQEEERARRRAARKKARLRREELHALALDDNRAWDRAERARLREEERARKRAEKRAERDAERARKKAEREEGRARQKAERALLREEERARKQAERDAERARKKAERWREAEERGAQLMEEARERNEKRALELAERREAARAQRREAAEARVEERVKEQTDPFKAFVTAHLANRFRALREEAGLSQEEVAVRASMHRTEISFLELGKRTAKIDTLVKMAGALDVHVEDILDGLEEGWRPGDLPPPPPPVDRAERPYANRKIDYSEVARLWKEDKTAQEIADAVGTTKGNVGQIVNRLRERGVDLPYRRPPMTAHHANARERRK